MPLTIQCCVPCIRQSRTWHHKMSSDDIPEAKIVNTSYKNKQGRVRPIGHNKSLSAHRFFLLSWTIKLAPRWVTRDNFTSYMYMQTSSEVLLVHMQFVSTFLAGGMLQRTLLATVMWRLLCICVLQRLIKESECWQCYRIWSEEGVRSCVVLYESGKLKAGNWPNS